MSQERTCAQRMFIISNLPGGHYVKWRACYEKKNVVTIDVGWYLFT